MAVSYQQLGIIAQLQGDQSEALHRYRQALAIFEELGDRNRMASAMRQIGILLTETGSPEDGFSWTLPSLCIRTELGSPQLSVDLQWLQRQQVLLGVQPFQQLLREELGDRHSQTVMEWIRQLSSREQL